MRRGALIAAALTTAGILMSLVVGLRLATETGAVAVARQVPPAGVRSIAVLPFRTVSDDRQDAHFGIGLADSITSHLSGLPGLNVRSMSSTLKVSAGVTDPLEAGRRLGVSTVLSGSCDRVGHRFEVRLRLLDVATSTVIYERSFDWKIDDLMGLESIVVSNVLATLAPGERPRAPARPHARHEPDPAAHYLYLLALGKLAMFQGSSVPDAVELLEQSIRIDPDYAGAHALLSVACSGMFYTGMTWNYSWIERAVASARRAIYLDEKSPAAHQALGHALLGAGEPVEAAREALLALELDPNHARSLRLLATLLTGAGLPEQVKLLRARIAAIDPEMDLDWLDIYVGFKERRQRETIELFESEVARRRAAGESIESQVMRLGYMAFMTGDSAAALRWAATMETVTEDKAYADIIRMLALARTGDAAAVVAILERNRAAYENDWEGCAWIGMALALIGKNDEAIEWIERSVQRGNYDYEHLNNAWDYDPLRADPRFEAALSVVRRRAREIIELAAFAGYR